MAKIKFDSFRLSNVELFPINLGHGKRRSISGRPVLADKNIGNKILTRIRTLSEKYGTVVKVQDNIGKIEL